MRILGIETSCDETAAAIYQGEAGGCGGKLLAERVASQIETHARFGGVVPEVASREHLAVLPGLVNAVMDEAGCGWQELDAIAVTAGPGLMGALLVGVSYARAAGMVNGLPVIPVHHMEGHLLAPGIDGALPPFPFVTLLVSGGHTMLVRVDGIGQYRVIGQTIDDAAGECFDKSARLLGLPYPGGPEIAALAEGGNAKRFRLPRPMLNRDNLDFSFSGLKTAVMYAVKNNGIKDMQTRRDLAAGVETAIAEVLVKKAVRACVKEEVGHLVIAGGVAANRRLRELMQTHAKKAAVSVYMPSPRFCTDNAAMIAYVGIQRGAGAKQMSQEWDVKARWPIS
jgi:N6-L-threonylcarbamoyladenine synthase